MPAVVMLVHGGLAAAAGLGPGGETRGDDAPIQVNATF